MELRLNTFPFYVSMENNFPFQFLMHIKMIKMGVELMGGDKNLIILLFQIRGARLNKVNYK